MVSDPNLSTESDSAANRLTAEQQVGLDLLNSGENVFVTGGAGSGKSYLIREFKKDLDPKLFPTLASTGSAAVLVGGRTFHSFFGLGIFEGGAQATFERAIRDGKLRKRITQVEGFIIDEVSMISAEQLDVAEKIAQTCRDSSLPWGGLRVICVGDFYQLPPVTRGFGQQKPWAFLSAAWQKTNFLSLQLHHSQRVKADPEFLDILNDARLGQVSGQLRRYLEAQVREHDEEDPSPRLFPRRDQADHFNQLKLHEINSDLIETPTIYLGEEKSVEALKKMSPLPEVLGLKEGAYVMLTQNDSQKRWVNGTTGRITQILTDKIKIQKKTSHNSDFTFGREITVEKAQFSLQDADGNVRASLIQFPLQLAYATTIHKSQGCTLDELWVDLSRLWESGQAYVALSRLSNRDGLKLLGWNAKSFIVDPAIKAFYSQLKTTE
jgi:ATP-dependent exoDNAse (exonuclease V) alpha subunit